MIIDAFHKFSVDGDKREEGSRSSASTRSTEPDDLPGRSSSFSRSLLSHS